MNRQINQLLDWQPNSELLRQPTVSPDVHKAGMRHLAVGVSIITASDGSARAGLTATAVCSVTADPPRLVVFINKNVIANRVILASGMLCVNVLAADQEMVGRAFAGMIDGVHGDERFLHGSWSTITTGAPALDGALVNFDCRVIKVYDESTHHAFLCEVLTVREGSGGDALLYLDGGFHQLPRPPLPNSGISRSNQ